VTVSSINASRRQWGPDLNGVCRTIAGTNPIARGAPGAMFAGRGSAEAKSADSKALSGLGDSDTFDDFGRLEGRS
jgi:hypothetical protein